MSRLLGFSSAEMHQNHIFRGLALDPTGRAYSTPLSRRGEGFAAPSQDAHPVPALRPSGLTLQLFGPRFTELPPG